MATKEQNLEFLNNSVSTLNQIATNPSTPKNIRKNIADIVEQLKSGEYSISVRAANTISLLDDVTQILIYHLTLEPLYGRLYQH